jgi:exodeoxyribonuclease V alpha subunit
MPARLDDFSYKITARPVDWVYKCITEGSIDWSTLDNQIICPVKKGWVGTYKINSLLQAYYQRDNTDIWVQLSRHPWAEDEDTRVTVGDKVIWTQNNYTLMIFNGETGIVIECSDLGEVVIDFGDRSVVVPSSMEVENRQGKVIPIDPRKDLDLAYAITTHKAQGSEYKRVMYVMNSSRAYLLNRNNFYTGTTRAREYVHVVTDQKGLVYSMRKPVN